MCSSLWLLALAMLALTACRKEGSYHAEGPMQRAGAWVDHAAVKTGEGVETAAQKTGQGMETAAKATASGMEDVGHTFQGAFSSRDAGPGGDAGPEAGR